MKFFHQNFFDIFYIFIKSLFIITEIFILGYSSPSDLLFGLVWFGLLVMSCNYIGETLENTFFAFAFYLHLARV